MDCRGFMIVKELHLLLFKIHIQDSLLHNYNQEYKIEDIVMINLYQGSLFCLKSILILHKQLQQNSNKHRNCLDLLLKLLLHFVSNLMKQAYLRQIVRVYVNLHQKQFFSMFQPKVVYALNNKYSFTLSLLLSLIRELTNSNNISNAWIRLHLF